MAKYLLLIVLLILVGCSNDDAIAEFDTESFPQTWNLKAMGFGLSGQVVSGDDLPYRAEIVLQNRGDFQKTRTSNDTVFRGQGTFQFTKNEINTLLTLVYDSETDLISSCSNEKIIEKLVLTSNSSLFGGASPCDGPALSFVRLE